MKGNSKKKLRKHWKKRCMAVMLAATIGLLQPAEQICAQESTAGRSVSTVTPASPVHHCASEGGESDYTEWSYIYFGSYPQSEVTDASLIADIDDALIEKKKLTGDVWINGTKYRKISSSDTNNTNYFGNSTFRYFKWERIKWKVLSNDGNRLFLVADRVLDCKKCNETFVNTTWETSTIRSWLNGYDSTKNGDGI